VDRQSRENYCNRLQDGLRNKHFQSKMDLQYSFMVGVVSMLVREEVEVDCGNCAGGIFPYSGDDELLHAYYRSK
jgi:hypothetical protein